MGPNLNPFYSIPCVAGKPVVQVVGSMTNEGQV